MGTAALIPRLLRIRFHTFCHWKGAMEYYRTKEPIYAKEILGHKSIQSTQVYIHVDGALFQNTAQKVPFSLCPTP
jgi:integrase